MDRTIDTAAAQQASVGRIDDGIDFHSRNVAVHNLQVFACHGVSWFWRTMDSRLTSSIGREIDLRSVADHRAKAAATWNSRVIS